MSEVDGQSEEGRDRWLLAEQMNVWRAAARAVRGKELWRPVKAKVTGQEEEKRKKRIRKEKETKENKRGRLEERMKEDELVPELETAEQVEEVPETDNSMDKFEVFDRRGGKKGKN